MARHIVETCQSSLYSRTFLQDYFLFLKKSIPSRSDETVPAAWVEVSHLNPSVLSQGETLYLNHQTSPHTSLSHIGSQDRDFNIEKRTGQARVRLWPRVTRVKKMEDTIAERSDHRLASSSVSYRCVSGKWFFDTRLGWSKISVRLCTNAVGNPGFPKCRRLHEENELRNRKKSSGGRRLGEKRGLPMLTGRQKCLHDVRFLQEPRIWESQ